MAYRANVTNKQQADIERAEDNSAIRIPWFTSDNVGATKSFRAYDLSAQAVAGATVSSNVRAIPNSGAVIGSHNDQPHSFATPGKA